jgi:hypothetical protein
MQQVSDRQMMLAAHRLLVSDERLPLVVTEQRSIKHLEGRVLGHGEDESTKNFGRHYMLLEGTDAKVHIIYYMNELEEARSRGQLDVNSFVELRRIFNNGQPLLHIESLGNSEKLLDNKKYFHQRAQLFLRNGECTPNETWGGWLGCYEEKLASAITAAQQRGMQIER